MAFNPDYRTMGRDAGIGSMDAGLRAYMLRVFNWMAIGLTITGLVAYGVVATSLRTLFFRVTEMADGTLVTGPTTLGVISIFAPLAFVLVLSFGVNRLSRSAAQGLFLLFSVAMGVSLSNLLLVYTGVSIARTFFIAACLFASVSLWGYTTGRSLSGMGSFLFMGLIGLVIASVVNMFLPGAKLSMLISFVGVILFTGFAAYDTQRIKLTYQQYMAYISPDEMAKHSVYDALSMYLNFINLFQFLLQFTGSRSSGSN